MPHEFVHSWNGKYRRPSGLATPNYQEPMIGDLLWVYEGLTEYLGNVLAARSGLLSDEQYRESLASTAAALNAAEGCPRAGCCHTVAQKVCPIIWRHFVERVHHVVHRIRHNSRRTALAAMEAAAKIVQ